MVKTLMRGGGGVDKLPTHDMTYMSLNMLYIYMYNSDHVFH